MPKITSESPKLFRPQTPSEEFQKLSRSKQWALLQQSHIQSQPYWNDHVIIHLKMLAHSLRTGQIAEAGIQIFFAFVAAPSSILKFYPKGHPGTMTIPPSTE